MEVVTSNDKILVWRSLQIFCSKNLTLGILDHWVAWSFVSCSNALKGFHSIYLGSPNCWSHIQASAAKSHYILFPCFMYFLVIDFLFFFVFLPAWYYLSVGASFGRSYREPKYKIEFHPEDSPFHPVSCNNLHACVWFMYILFPCISIC